MAEDLKPKEEHSKNSIKVDRSTFGVLKPLTAVQVVTLLIHSEVALGACACGPCGGPCGPCY